MPSWNELTTELEKIGAADPIAGNNWVRTNIGEWLSRLSAKRGGRNVMLYASAFLQKPQAPGILLSITHEDINGFMSVMKGMDWSKNLTLVLHTPGGVTNAAETIVEYLHQKFSDIEVVVPTFAMSAGTMLSLAANRLVMGRQSQLGPIDPQMPFGGRTVSARAIVDQFETAKKDVGADIKAAAVWAPILQSLGPSLLKEAQDALDYSENMVCRWLARRAFAAEATPEKKAAAVAQYFNRSDSHKSHGRRIDRDEVRAQGIVVENLEDDAELQEIVLTIYHLATMVFEKGPSSKFLSRDNGVAWVKNL